MSNCNLKEITLDGVKYVRADSIASPIVPGKRHVLVLDRGWIVAGDLEEKDSRILVTRALHVRHWSNVGFDGMVANPKCKDVKIVPLANGFNVPAECELFRVPVDDSWGL